MGGVCSFFFGCCSAGSSRDKSGTTLVADRSCTDKLVLLLWLAAWAVSIAVISIAARDGGNPQKILNAIDYNGNICGYSDAVRDRPLGAMLNPLAGDTDALRGWTCVDDCAQTKNTNNSELSAMYGSTNCQRNGNTKSASEGDCLSLPLAHKRSLLSLSCLLQFSATVFRRSISTTVL